ncbi:hypothetical protein R6Q59_023234 [Mikania micrantha]|uniref:Uncharacterized protein n=1 Tax=Mikania micrantha TaxID=192012 RepID=A0A5N6MUZ2_9ASTR|nr:hypothetical protein E3N88_26602 [Mikania micrantha]
MKLNSELTDDAGIDYQILPETVMTNHRGVGATKFTRIIEEEECNSSNSSSIGNNSDEDEDREGDVQSEYRYDHEDQKTTNGSLDDAIQALEEALPIRKGISTFYNGKSKSFTCLANMWSSTTSTINDIAKPDNAFNRKRRNLLASTLLSHKYKNPSFQLSTISAGQISKKPKTVLHFASEDTKIQNLNRSSMRSFSMVNLHQCSSRFGLKSTQVENC